MTKNRRYLYAASVMLATMGNYICRQNLNIAIVDMTKRYYGHTSLVLRGTIHLFSYNSAKMNKRKMLVFVKFPVYLQAICRSM